MYQPNLPHLKSKIITAINSITDYTELYNIDSYIRRKEIKSIAAKVLDKKISKLHVNLDDKIAKILSDISFTFEEKHLLLSKIYDDKGIWDASNILKYKHHNIKPMINLHGLNHTLVKEFGKLLMLEFQGNLGFNAATIGPGEFFIAFTGQHADFATKGDLIIGSSLIEVKATVKGKKSFAGGRLVANTGYGANTLVKSKLIEYFKNAGVPDNILQTYGWGENTKSNVVGGLNLNQSGINNMSNVCNTFLGETKTKKMLEELIYNMFYDTSLYKIDGVLSCVDGDGRINNNKFQTELIKLAHIYYATKEEHDAILYLNTDNWNYVLVNDVNDYDELFSSGKLKVTSGIDFNEDRAKGSAQVLVT